MGESGMIWSGGLCDLFFHAYRRVSIAAVNIEGELTCLFCLWDLEAIAISSGLDVATRK